MNVLDNKKTIIISTLIIFIIIIVSIFSIMGKPSDDNSIEKIDNMIASDQKITEDSYYVEPGLEDMAKIVKPAVESFADQDIAEKNEDRIKRLKKYFTSDSPVYLYEQTNISGGEVTKSVAKVTSVVQCDSQEDGSFCLNVMTSTTFYVGDQTSIRPQTYGITVKYIDNSYVAEDIGIIK